MSGFNNYRGKKAPSSPKASATINQNTKRLAQVNEASPRVKYTDLKRHASDARPFGVICPDGEPVVAPHVQPINLYTLAGAFKHLRSWSVEVKVTTSYKDADGNPVVTTRYFGPCPKCEGTGLYTGHEPVVNNYTEAPRDCLPIKGDVSCGTHFQYTAGISPENPRHGTYLVEWFEPKAFLDLFFEAVGQYDRGARELQWGSAKRFFINTLVKSTYALYSRLQAILSDDLEGQAARNGISIEECRQRREADHPLAAEILTTEVNGRSLMDLVRYLSSENPYAPLWAELEEGNAYKAAPQRGLGASSRDAVVFGDYTPGDTSTPTVAEVVEKLNAFFLTNDLGFLQSRPRELVRKLLAQVPADTMSSKELVMVVTQDGVGPKSVEAICNHAGIPASGFKALLESV